MQWREERKELFLATLACDLDGARQRFMISIRNSPDGDLVENGSDAATDKFPNNGDHDNDYGLCWRQ